jgi:hypothetical protein
MDCDWMDTLSKNVWIFISSPPYTSQILATYYAGSYVPQ